MHVVLLFPARTLILVYFIINRRVLGITESDATLVKIINNDFERNGNFRFV